MMHSFEVRIVDPDGQPISLGDAPANLGLPDNKVRELRGQFNVGKPPMLNVGDSQVVPIAMNIDGLVFEKPATYTVVISVDGNPMRSLPIRVRATVPTPGPMQLSGPGA